MQTSGKLHAANPVSRLAVLYCFLLKEGKLTEFCLDLGEKNRGKRLTNRLSLTIDAFSAVRSLRQENTCVRLRALSTNPWSSDAV